MDVDQKKKKKRSAEKVQPTSCSHKRKKKTKIVINKSQQFEDWKKIAHHLLHYEMIHRIMTTQTGLSDATRASHHLYTTQSVIMPYMVCKSSQSDGGHSLTREFLYDVYKNYKQLQNLLRCVSSNHKEEMFMINVAQEMFPEAGFRSGEMLNKNIKSLTFAVLTACAQHVTLKLSPVSATKERKEQEDVFSLATVTPKQQKEACEWLATNWSHGVRAVMLEVGSHRQPSKMPVFNSDSWWTFVKSLLRLGFGFGLRMDPQSGIRTVIANSFYAKHNVDVLAIIETHREQTKRKEGESIEKPTTMHNGRKFGQYPATIRHCDLCPPGPPVLCVRQFGSQWLCMRGSSTSGGRLGHKCHRDCHSQIDMGYLDEEPPL
jgi:hypothetical protein